MWQLHLAICHLSEIINEKKSGLGRQLTGIPFMINSSRSQDSNTSGAKSG
jgi:hypothetical protein